LQGKDRARWSGLALALTAAGTLALADLGAAGERDAEVHDDDTVGTHDDVARFEVTVNDADRVRRRQALPRARNTSRTARNVRPVRASQALSVGPPMSSIARKT